MVQTTIKLLSPEINRDKSQQLQLQEELINIYQALRNLAYTLDVTVGREIRTAEQMQESVNVDIRTLAPIENFSIIYLPFTMDATYGKLVAVNSSGQAIFPYAGGLQAQAYGMPIGFVAEESVEAGTYGKVCVRGFIKTSGLTINDQYTWDYSTPNGNFVNARPLIKYSSVIAKAISTDVIYFTGVTERHAE